MEISIEMLQAKADQTLEAIAEIKDQISRAKANAAKSGDYSDSDWFLRANRALKHKQADHQLLLRETAKARAAKKEQAQKESEKRSLTFEREFMRAAKRLLDEPTYTSIMLEAKRHIP